MSDSNLTNNNEETNNGEAVVRRLIPVTKWPEYHDHPSVGGLRHLIFHAESNGFSKCIKRIGRRVLIDEPRYFEWVDEQNNHSTP